MNLDKLKESARKYEQSGQWRPAIDVYKKALREFEESGEGVLDPSLYNRIGDLEMKDGESAAAIRAYEQAADLYTEQGFLNNAIALCGKILRINSSRTSSYLRLAQLNARKNFVGESRKNLLEYVERMEAMQHRDEALAAIRAFADQFRSNTEITAMVLDVVRASTRHPDSRESLDKLALELEARADPDGARRRERVATVDGAATSQRASSGGDLVFLDLGQSSRTGSAGPTAAVEGLEVLQPEIGSDEEWQRDTSTVDGIEMSAGDFDFDGASAVPDLLAAGELEEIGGDEIPSLDIDAYPTAEGFDAADPIELDEEGGAADREGRGVGTVGPGPAPAAPGSDLVFLPVDEDRTGGDRSTSPDNDIAALRSRARLLLTVGDRRGGLEALDRALELLESSGRYDEALEVGAELTDLEPDVVYRFQKRVELAYRSGHRDAMLDAYLRLADALLRGGGLEHALTVYRRVIEHDPGNQAARLAIETLTAPAPAPPPTFVDLGSLILDEPQVRDTRIRVDQSAPIEDEDQAFHEALAQFKRGIEANIDAEDFQAHYDLGIAFKEMGLLDEAIAQFQKALRAPEGRLKTSEQLGIAFFEKARFAIAEAVLRRAIESLAGGDEEKIGLIYWLGRAVEAQRRVEEAIRCYERALAVDIRFLDVSERMHRLSVEP